MNTTAIFPGFETLVKPFKFAASPYEYRVTALRECPTPESLQHCETPDKAADYWRMHIATHPHFNPDCECLAVLLLNTRRKVKGHQIVSIGTMDTILVHPREIFRLAIMTAASAVVMMHNHPSGESTPSDADIKVTRDLIRAGQLSSKTQRDSLHHNSSRELPTQKVLELLKAQLPRQYELAEIVGKWVWIQFDQKQPATVTSVLSELGFHWNSKRQSWQHPCGIFRDQSSPIDPRMKYGSRLAADVKPA